MQLDLQLGLASGPLHVISSRTAMCAMGELLKACAVMLLTVLILVVVVLILRLHVISCRTAM